MASAKRLAANRAFRSIVDGFAALYSILHAPLVVVVVFCTFELECLGLVHDVKHLAIHGGIICFDLHHHIHDHTAMILRATVFKCNMAALKCSVL
jgi:hypothetical protein